MIAVKPLHNLKAWSPILVNDSGSVIVVKPLHSSKALFPILVNDSGNVIVVKPVQPSKALSPILVNDSGSVIVVKPVQPAKAALPILVNDSGSVIVFKPLNPSQRLSGICSTWSPKVKVVILVLQKRELPLPQARAFQVTEVKPVQPEKALPPILVTDSGIVIEVKPFNSEQRPLGICSTWFPKVKVVIFVSLLTMSPQLLRKR